MIELGEQIERYPAYGQQIATEVKDMVFRDITWQVLVHRDIFHSR